MAAISNFISKVTAPASGVDSAVPLGGGDDSNDALMQEVHQAMQFAQQMSDSMSADGSSGNDDNSTDASLDDSQAPAAAPLPQMPQVQAPQTDAASQGGGNGAPMSDTQAISTLEQHEGDFSKHGTKISDLQKRLSDSTTPADEKAAIQTVLSDPNLKAQLDGNGDGKISSKDINRMAQDPAVKAYNNQKAQSYVNNYIPSGSDATQGRPMTEQDAMNELNQYSDQLGKNISPTTFQQITDGTSGAGKSPPQLIAAAQYFQDHPDQWKDLNNGKDTVKTSEFETNYANKSQLTQQETDAAQRIVDDPNHVFEGKITRDSLQKIINDPKADPADKAAAKAMYGQDGSTNLFEKSDNFFGGSKDYTAHGKYVVNDGSFTKDNVSKMLAAEKQNGVYAPPPTQAPKTPQDAAAVNDMLMGEDNAAGDKKEQKSGIKKFVDGLMKFGEIFLKIGSKILGALAKLPIPGLSQLLKAGSVGLEAGSDAIKIGQTAYDGGDVKKAAADAGFDLAGEMGDMIPGGGAIVSAGLAGAQAVVDKKLDAQHA